MKLLNECKKGLKKLIFSKKLFVPLLIISILVLIACNKEETACPEIYQPVCGVDGNTYANNCFAGSVQIAHDGECEKSTEGLSPEQACATLNGKWIQNAQECEGISREDCTKINGYFTECASACRNDPNAQICTLQCVPVCGFV